MAISLHPGDIAAIVVYFLIIVAVGLWTTLRKNKGSSTGYFLAGRQMTWLPIGASVFASNVGAPMFVGLSGSAAVSGIAPTTYEWHAIYMIILLGWFFLPVYISSGCKTMPEYMKKRFGGERLRTLFSVQAMIIYVLVNITGQMYTGSLFIKFILGWDIYISSFILLILTVVYTVAGGLSTVMWTDTVQTFILVIGTLAITVMSLVKIGGYERMTEEFLAASAPSVVETHTRFGNWSCGMPREDSFHLWRDAITADLPWPGMVFGLTSIAMFVWCNDQIMVQRALAAKDMVHAKGGAVFASFLKLTSFALFIIPGLCSRVLYPEYVACATPESCRAQCGSKLGCSNYAYPLLVLNVLPVGATGVVLAAILSALMSSLTSILNSASSIFTLDLWTRCRPRATEAEKMVVGRVFIIILSGIAIAVLPLVENAGEAQFWNYMQAITSYVAPPCSMCFLVAVLWTRATEPGAFWSVFAGLVIGMVRLVLDFIYQTPLCGSGDPDPRPSVLTRVHFLHFAILLSAICVIINVCVSVITRPRSAKQMNRMTWWTRLEEEEPEVSGSNQDVPAGPTRQVKDRSDNSEEPAEIAVTNESWKSKCMFWLCGIHLDKMAADGTEEPNSDGINLLLQKHSAHKTALVNASAVVCLVLTTFLLGFFG